MIQLRLLGALELMGSDGASVLSVLSQPKRVALLAYLAAAQPHGFHTRDKLLALFWPESDEEHARNALRQSLHFLRRSLGEEAVLTRGEEVSANHDLIKCDVVSFNQAVESGDLDTACEQYRGPLLEGFHLSGAPGFVDWLEEERERLRVSAVRVGEELSARLEIEGDLAGAVEAARRVTRLAPGNGRAAQRLIELLGRRGDRAGAIRVYEAFKARLSDEFGLEPSEEIEAAVERIRSGEGARRRPEVEVRRGHVASPRTPKGQTRASVRKKGVRGRPYRPGMTRRGMIVVSVVALAALALLRVLAGPVVKDRRIPVLVWGFPVASTEAPDREFCDSLVEMLRTVMDQSERVRPVQYTSTFDFLLQGRIDPDSSYLSLTGFSPSDSRLRTWNISDLIPMSPSVLRRRVVEIAGQIEHEVLAAVDTSPPPVVATDASAYRSYTQGRTLWELRNPMVFDEAVVRFRNAVTEDPEFALAWAALADAYNLLGAYDYGVYPPDSARQLARAAADTAVALNGRLAQAQTALATTHFFYEWDFTTAKTLYHNAIDLDPEYGHARHYLALLLAAEKRFGEALEMIDEAILFDPTEVLLSARARVLYFAGRYSEAREGYGQALERDPNHIPALLGLGLSSVMERDFEAAREAYAQADARLESRGLVVFALRGHLLGLDGKIEAARSIIGELQGARQRGFFVPPEYFAMIHLGLGELETALDSLEAAYRNRSNAMTVLEVEPLTRPLRDNPRFLALVRRVREGIVP